MPLSGSKTVDKIIHFIVPIFNVKHCIPMTDLKVRKCLKQTKGNLGLHAGFFIFMWSSDWIWQYIQSDHKSGENLAKILADVINA